MARTGKAKANVWRWRRRFAEAGVEGVLCDATRPPHEAPHWTARAMVRAAGLGVATVQRNRAAHGLASHRRRVFKRSRDPALVEKLADIAGLYVSPPAHVVVLSVDEKSHIQALDRTRSGLPLKKGRGAAMTHDDKRNGATTLLAAANVLTGEVFGKNMAPHRASRLLSGPPFSLPRFRAAI